MTMSISLLFPHKPFPLLHSPHSHSHFPNPNSTFTPLRRYRTVRFSLNPQFPPPHTSTHSPQNPELPQKLLLRLSVSVIVFLGFGLRPCSATPTRLPPPVASVDSSHTLQHDPKIQDDHLQGNYNDVEKLEDEKLNAEFEAWKSKTYALSVPLRIVSLRGSVPPSWVKDFIQSQGRRVQLRSQFQGSLEDIFSGLSMPLRKGKVGPKSTASADLVSVGDSWLNYAINKAIIEPIRGVENQDWFKSLSDKWKVYLRRNCAGELDPQGEIWAAPYRWGTMVIAYKKSKFQKYNLAPIEDWADLWRPELAGRISMVDSPREVVGAVLKYMGASYNTKNIDLQVAGGRNAVQQNLALLGKQVRLFDSIHYLKAFGVGDVWVAVGWSSDVLPIAQRMSNVTVIVPKSGASLWADLWAIPAASRFKTDQIGGRIRGPSPLIHQWIEFCLQAARALPFKQEIIPGASPYALETAQVQLPKELTNGKPRLDTNLIAGVPPPDILARCEFLEPLSEATLSVYQWLIVSMQKPDPGMIYRIQHYVSSMIQTLQQMLHSKVA